MTVLFALSLDLVLGYAGIVTLGHAAFFGAGAYTVGMLAKQGVWNEPLTGLVAAVLVAAAVGLGSGLVLLRTHGLTLLMLTLCTMALLEEAANLGHAYTGGFDGLDSLRIAPLFGRVRVQPAVSADAVPLRARRALRLLRVRAHAGLLAVRPEPHRHPREHPSHARGGRAGAATPRPLLHAVRGHRGDRRRHLGAGERLRQPRHVRPGPGGHRADHPRPRRPRAPLRRLRGRRRVHGAGPLPLEDLSHGVAARAGRAARRDRAVREERLARRGGGGLRSGGRGRRREPPRPTPMPDRAAAGDPGAVRELRGARRRARHRLPARDRRAPRPDRAQRRGQDDAREPAHRRARARARARCG